MNQKKRLMVAVFAGLLVSLSVGTYIDRAKKRIQSQYTMTTVLKAKKYIPRGRMVTNKMVEKALIPAAFLQPTALAEEKGLQGRDGKFGLKTRIDILKGEQITRSKLYTEKGLLGLAWVIPEGVGAVSLRLRTDQAVGGHVQPGDWVHVLATLDRQPSWPEAKTTILLKRIQVLAVFDRMWDPGDPTLDKMEWKGMETDSMMITLGVTPGQAAELALAEAKGDLKLVLISSMDRSVPKNVSVNLSGLN